MNIPQGYKQTELGIIPEDWQLQSVGKHCSVKARIGWQGLRSDEYLTSGEYGLITSTDIVDGMVDWGTCCFVSKARYSQDPNIIVQENDTLISKDGTIGKVGIVQNIPFPSTLNSGIFVVRPKLDNVYKKYFAFAFKSIYFQDFINRLTAGSTIVHLYQKDIVKFVFPVPPIVEQRAIAEALSDVDGLIAAMDKKIAKKRLLKQGAMQQLLTGKKRLPGFTDEWVEKKLESIADIYQPQTISQEEFSIDGYDVYGANGVIGKYHLYNHTTEQVMVTCRGSSCGTVNMSAGKCWITGNAMILNMDKYDVSKTFIYYYLLNQDLSELITGSGQPQIVRTPLSEYVVKIPFDRIEQQAIATILSDMDKEIADLEAQRDKYRLLKSGMMQKLLTGQIRLKRE
jgi:type I restriction enzyme S subunit